METAGAVHPPPPVCCMCGDRGLPGELFRCKLCLCRTQHKYCSEAFPKADAYEACNWCLREERGKVAARSSKAGTARLGLPEVAPSQTGRVAGHSFKGKVKRYKLLEEVSS